MERELCSRSLAEFVKLAWHVLEPTQEYIHGWHIDFICAHLEAVTRGEITRLLINCPPGVMKSMLVGVFWPVWEWGPKGLASNRFLCGSHSGAFATRDNMRSRRLVFSKWFQNRWPLKLQNDQDTKTKFENVKTGWRTASAMSSMTGDRGDRVIIDDPHSVEGAISDAERTTTLRIFQETVSTRLNNPDKSAIVVIMQRLHENDVSGHIIAEQKDYVHLMLPMRHEIERHCKTQFGEDPRKEEGELLFPDRFPLSVVEQEEKAMGPFGTACQFAQTPAPRGGQLIPFGKIQIMKVAPVRFITVWRYWDKAGTKGGGARTAGVKIGLDHEGLMWILDVVKGQWAAPEREKIITQTMQTDGVRVRVGVEQEPGSGGKESAESTISSNFGFIVHADRPTGDKSFRAEPFAVQVDAGNVRMLEADWNADYLHEAQFFPSGKYRDQIDATSGAVAKIAASGIGRLNLLMKVNVPPSPGTIKEAQ